MPGEGVAVDDEDPFWARVSVLERAEDAQASTLAEERRSDPDKDDEPTDDKARPTPPVLSLRPPDEDHDDPLSPTSPAASEYASPIGSDAGGALARPRTRRQALLRPLFVYATLNPGLSYVQGCAFFHRWGSAI